MTIVEIIAVMNVIENLEEMALSQGKEPGDGLDHVLATGLVGDDLDHDLATGTPGDDLEQNLMKGVGLDHNLLIGRSKGQGHTLVINAGVVQDLVVGAGIIQVQLRDVRVVQGL